MASRGSQSATPVRRVPIHLQVFTRLFTFQQMFNEWKRERQHTRNINKNEQIDTQ